MNKTVNINLANTFFHIDEEAYTKLRRYLESIKRSFAGTSGSDEIIADIEARIAELFQEKMEHDRQVITQKEIDEVINIMGQPEDYMVDEDIFEDEPRPKGGTGTERIKKLYRDIEQKYIGGVCSGLEHYTGVDALWIRLIFILLAVFTGFGLIAYILLWILVPEANTTSQKLNMRGEPINISNIERKVKEGFDDVAEKVKSVDYEKVGDKVKSSSKTFFDTVGDIILFLFKIFGKFVGILLIIIGAATLIGLFVGLFTVGVIDVVHFPGVDLYDIVNTTGAPVWLVSLLCFFAIGIPFFFLLYLGLKILVTNLKSIGNIAKFSLLGLWLIAVGTLVTLGVRQAVSSAFTGTTTINEEFYVENPTDTLLISMRAAQTIDDDYRFVFDNLKMAYDENGTPLLYSEDVRVDIKKSTDSIVRVKIKKDAEGSSFEEARERSSQIEYSYSFGSNEMIFDDFLTTDPKNKARDQEVRSTVYLPEGTMVRFNENVKGHMGRGTRNNRDYYRNKIVDYLWIMGSNGELTCLDCPDDLDGDERSSNDGDARIIIDGNGVDISIEDKDDSFKMTIDEEGVEVEAEEKN